MVCCVPTNCAPLPNSPRRYAHGIADITVRQNIQLHWITIEALPDLLEALGRVGLNTTSACGDVTRMSPAARWQAWMRMKFAMLRL